MKDYIHEVHYYETDQMGVVHHSNYIRWMEEARTYFLREVGFGYKEMEESGVISPVVSVSSEYKVSAQYGDKISVHVFVKENDGVRLVIGYNMTNVETGKLCNVGESSHCFIKNGKIISIKKSMPEFYECLENYRE